MRRFLLKPSLILEETSVAVAESDGKSEIWFHEDCFIWVPCTALVGGRLVGMEEAVEQTRGLECAVCACAGASVGCTEHGCRDAAHLACATGAAWDLDMDNFRVRCSKCKAKKGQKI